MKKNKALETQYTPFDDDFVPACATVSRALDRKGMTIEKIVAIFCSIIDDMVIRQANLVRKENPEMQSIPICEVDKSIIKLVTKYYGLMIEAREVEAIEKNGVTFVQQKENN